MPQHINLKSRRAIASWFVTFPFALVLSLLLTACAQRTASVKYEEPYPVRATPKVDERAVTVSGEVLEFPAGAAIPTLLASPALRENDLATLEATPGARMLLRPRMKVNNGTTGRFKLKIENRPDQVALELTPRIQAGGQVALSARIEARGPSGVADSISRDVIFQANSGDYSVYGPIKMDDHTAYALLRVDLE